MDWARVDRALCETYGLTPREVDDLTLAEIAVLCKPADEKGPPGGRAMSDREVAEEAARWKALTARERLDSAIRRRAE